MIEDLKECFLTMRGKCKSFPWLFHWPVVEKWFIRKNELWRELFCPTCCEATFQKDTGNAITGRAKWVTTKFPPQREP